MEDQERDKTEPSDPDVEAHKRVLGATDEGDPEQVRREGDDEEPEVEGHMRKL